MNQLIGEFKSLKGVCADQDAKNLAAGLVKRAQAVGANGMTWGDAYMLDTAIAQMLPLEYLHQRAWCLEAKYKDAAGNSAAYDAFMKAEAPHFVDEKPEHLRARIHNLIRELYRLYTVISCRAEMRESILAKALTVLAIVFGTVILLSLWSYVWPPLRPFEIWWIVFAVGATGGLLSLYLRLQSLPMHGESLSDLVELSGRMTVPFTPVIGGTFAVVLFVLFGSGLASGSLFPQWPKDIGSSDFWAFTRLQPASTVSDWGKLLVWSFLAGFAERLVPDTLDRLIARSNESKRDTK
jgi:hypothetical protein